MVTASLLEQWGRPGFYAHVDEVEAFYKRRRDLMVEAAEEHLGGLVEFSVPLGGMFLWIKVVLVPPSPWCRCPASPLHGT